MTAHQRAQTHHMRESSSIVLQSNSCRLPLANLQVAMLPIGNIAMCVELHL